MNSRISLVIVLLRGSLLRDRRGQHTFGVGSMRIRTACLTTGAVGLSAFLYACVVSIDPVIRDSAATFDARLLGDWEEVGGSDRATVARDSGDTYLIEYESEARTGRFRARLGRLGSLSVLDAWPDPASSTPLEPYAGAIVAGHVLLVLDILPEEIRVRMLNADTLAARLDAGRLLLDSRSNEKQLVLLDSTDGLRSVLTSYLASPGALSDAGVFRRAPEGRLHPVNVPCFEASAWREADRLFRSDPHWVGADVASTVDLGSGRTLWLFGDTWIDASGRGQREGARMVSNSVAIQTGSNPATASIAFYWGRSPDGTPDALFPDREGESLWFGNGVRIDDRLILFFSRVVRNTGTGLAFDEVGWTAVMVENPDDEPSRWRTHALETPANPLGVLVGSATVLRSGDYVYALGSENPVKSHPVYVVRWPAGAVRRGDLHAPEWWAGRREGWAPDTSSLQRWPLFENGQSGLSVHFDTLTGRFLEVQTRGFGSADVIMRAAPALVGPWSAPHMVYRPSEYYRPGVMIYSAKAHPMLTGADLVLTYATNTSNADEMITDHSIYYPRFVRLKQCP
ncbi:MAG: DUF4185 domain-containing protein [Gemmatimonadota bacterium]